MPSRPSLRFPLRGCSSLLLFSSDASESADPHFLQAVGAPLDGAILVWTTRGRTLLTSRMNAAAARAHFKGPVLAPEYKEIYSTLRSLLPPGPIGLDFSRLSAARYLRLGKLLGRSRLVDVGAQLDELRRVKRPEQIRRIARAVRLSKEILAQLELSPTMSEQEVVRRLGMACAERNVSFAYPPIVAAGAHAREPHHLPSTKRLGSNVVLIDFGVRYEHFCADLTRCYFLGPCPAERKKYAQAQLFHQALLDELPSLHTGGELARFADAYSARIGWGRMIHAIGHGLGLEVHDPPHLGLKSAEPLEPGVVLALEPGWYGPRFGVRYEDDVVWGKKKARLL